MTARELIELENENFDRIILHREGLFWRAYEHSAYALCTLVHPFKTKKRRLKVLGGKELVYVGFPTASEEKYLQGFDRETNGDNCLMLLLPTPIDKMLFLDWKSTIKSETLFPAEAQEKTTSVTVETLLNDFNLADSTPLECMNLVSQLQGIIRKR